MKNVRHEGSRHIRNKRGGYMKDETNDLETPVGGRRLGRTQTELDLERVTRLELIW
jgi:hypothetical protein